MNWKKLEGLGWALGTAVLVSIGSFFMSPENVSMERVKQLPGTVIPAAAGVLVAWGRGLKTDPEDLK